MVIGFIHIHTVNQFYSGQPPDCTLLALIVSFKLWTCRHGVKQSSSLFARNKQQKTLSDIDFWRAVRSLQYTNTILWHKNINTLQ